MHTSSLLLPEISAAGERCSSLNVRRPIPLVCIWIFIHLHKWHDSVYERAVLLNELTPPHHVSVYVYTYVHIYVTYLCPCTVCICVYIYILYVCIYIFICDKTMSVSEQCSLPNEHRPTTLVCSCIYQYIFLWHIPVNTYSTLVHIPYIFHTTYSCEYIFHTSM